jgi:PAS domain S-box-containing protein/putative nucleotidyltransferase with HDIG domain
MTKILIVDDDSQNLYLLETLLKAHGYAVTSAWNGAEAMALALKNPPDVIVTDVLMPEMDGFELCRRWKAAERLQQIPFIIYTATYTDLKDEQFALSLGADRFIIKPEQPEVLVHIIQEVLSKPLKAKQVSSKISPEDEKVVLQRYNEVLFRKLEKKVLQLEDVIVKQKRTENELLALAQKYRSLITQSADGIFVVNLKGTFLAVNRAMCETLKYSEEQLLSMRIWDIVPEQYIDQHKKRIADILAGKALNEPAEYVVKGKDGNLHYIEVLSAPYYEGKELIGFQGIARDTTQRKQAEEALRESEEKYRLIVENSRDIIFVLNPAGEFVYVSPSISSILGYSQAEFTGRHIEFLIHPDDLPTVQEAISRSIEEGYQTPGTEYRVRHASGEWYWYSARGTVVRDEAGKFISFIGIANDITERKIAEAEIAHLASFPEDNPNPVIEIKLDGKISYMNAVARLVFPDMASLGISHPFLLGVEDLRTALHDMKARTIFRQLKIVDTWWEETIFLNPSGNDMRIYGIDITERKLGEKALAESEAQYRLLSENTTDIVWLMDMNLKPIYQSPSVEKLRGYTPQEVLDLPLEKQVAPESLKLALKVFSEEIPKVEADPGYNPVIKLDIEYYRKDGTTVWAESNFSLIRNPSGKPISILAEARDITERRLVRQIIEKQREEYRTIFDAVRPMIAYLDKEGVIQRINKSGAVTVNQEPKEIVGKTMYDFFPAAEADKFAEADKQVIASGKPLTGLISEYTRPSDQKRWAQIDRIPYFDENGDVIGIIVLGQDITRRKLAEEKLEKSYQSLKKTLNDAIDTMVKIVEMRDPYTAGHQQKVADLATAIAREMKLDDSRIDQLRMAAVIHDIGKMYVPSEILSKPGKLSKMEFELVKTHPQHGYNTIKVMDFPYSVAQAILQHHERLDGSGYPNGLTSESILLEAKILAVADVVEAMSSHRPYRPKLGIDEALTEISKNKGKLYDPDVVDACLRVFNIDKFEFKSV